MLFLWREGGLFYAVPAEDRPESAARAYRSLLGKRGA